MTKTNKCIDWRKKFALIKRETYYVYFTCPAGKFWNYRNFIKKGIGLLFMCVY